MTHDDHDAPEMFFVKGAQGPLPFLDGENVLVNAGDVWRNSSSGFIMDVPDAKSLFVDSGGYQATRYFGNEYPYSPTDLFEWAASIDADYVAAMDWVCSPAEAIAATDEALSADAIAPMNKRLSWALRDQRRATAVYEERDWPFQLVPVVQGHTVEQYRWFARELRYHGLATSYMGIGSLKGADTDKLHRVLKVCEEELPQTEFHLLGATKRVWNDRRFWGRFRSSDTHAWGKKTPDGEWVYSNEDRKRAHAGYRSDIDSCRERMTAADGFGGDCRSQAVKRNGRRLGAMSCPCGHDIPAYEHEFEPQCEFCARLALNRWDAALTEIEDIASCDIEEDAQADATQTTLVAGHDGSEATDRGRSTSNDESDASRQATLSLG